MSQPASTLQKTAFVLLDNLNKLATQLDRRPFLCIALLWLAAAPYTVIKAYVSHLTCDEVYTYRIAQQPTIGQMLAVSRTIDLHPPLHYLAERAALAIPLPNLVAERLPSLLATLGTLTFLFLFASRRSAHLTTPSFRAESRNRSISSALPGLFAATLFFFSPGMDFAWSNRPYALWLCLLACSAWLWKRATASPNILWPIALFCSVLAMAMDYMSGLVCILPLMLAELVRTRRTRTISWRIWIALILPCAAGVLYLHQVTDFAHNGFAPRYLDWFSTAQDMYAGLATLPFAVAIACALAATLLTQTARPTEPTEPLIPFALEDLTLGLALVLLPTLLALVAAFHHSQFFVRYGACGAIGFAILLTWALQRYSPSFRLVATFAAIALVITGIVQANNAPFVFNGPWRATHATGVAPQHLDKLDPTIPLVIASAIGYTEMTQHEPDFLLAHTYYLTDRPSALRYSGSTVFEEMATTATLLGYHSRTEHLTPFLAEHSKFFLVADYVEPEEWLPRALMANGANIQYLGKFASDYQDEDLYLVTTK